MEYKRLSSEEMREKHVSKFKQKSNYIYRN